MATPIHIPVLREEVLKALNIQPGKRYIDCTLGLGGHAKSILENSQPGGMLLGIDADPDAIRLAKTTLANYAKTTIIVNDNFVNLERICKENDFLPVQGILFDLGISSAQLEAPRRGFSFQYDSPLDMRIDPTQQLTASDIVNTYTENELANIIWNYGEERYSHRIARHIISNRPISSTTELARAIEQAIGRRTEKIHPATRTFMALRIAVNHELANLAHALEQAINCLDHEGRLAVISYHSLEDRVAKQLMIKESKGCLCSPSAPVCQCKHKPALALVSRKAIKPSLGEIALNPRSRSAKLRVAERL
ncbi:MAG: 16S rRNA (cytosine(1402)-N(4))-methyltransferase RsmH [Chloroflexi bacterium]|nr:16S rRNA (cytosine(1402)-N(4))-methyltransferase RsmH [Chloroflexota bacterium]MBM3154488.1 16S rRNA (cytosine(1402)-N(4))-methyltransferase RsmH [Chloroflexota bacterium]MBM3172282.1 16S rRNA (cytosine(1402)-N(4))-methyltransferase RsmH [Chloroflexota bacterium]MBM3174754.1 16S rRNA (cytosine(1402)-N(4))-methyltransferase RsmH [Chloroflexota bacterium]MBM4449845.1 16S rRNA (cytosine(1402)-N(4))-methyltransferase RsmH [Chloroflexota bacterium]